MGVFLTRFCLNNPVTVTLFYIFVVLVGVIAFLAMGRSILPPVSLPVVTVAAPYPGAGPQEIERLIVEPIEDQIDQLPDVERVSASAQNGIAEITVRFRFGSNLEADLAGVQQAVNAAQANMPSDLVAPVVSKDNPTQAPILEEAVSSAVLSPGDLAQLVSRTIVPALHSTSGVGSVLTSGASLRQFTVRPEIAPLNALGGTVLDVFRAVSRGNDILPGGVLKTPLQQSTIGINAAANSKEQLEALPLAIPAGPSVRLRDVAQVSDGYVDQTVVSRVDADPSIVVFVSNAAGADSIGTIKAVRKTFQVLARRDQVVRFEQLRSDEPYTRAATTGVLQTLGEGVVLTVLVMLLFLHAWRNAFIAAISIPTSLCAAFATMWAFGFTINVLSLMGLSLTIGILVDDSIVIIEAIARGAARGLEADQAALAGRRELGSAAFAITLVDVAVFTPIALMSGVVGEFMREFGLVIVFATAFSLLVSFTLTPLLEARWALRRGGLSLGSLSFAQIVAALEARSTTLPWTFRTHAVRRILAGWHACINSFNAGETYVAHRYAEQWLPAAARRPRVVLAVAASACILSFIPLFAGWIPTEFSPPVNRGEVTLDLTFPPGTPLNRTDAAATRMANGLLDSAAIKHVESSAGRAFNGSADIFASNVAQLGIVLSDPNSSGNDVLESAKALSYLVPGGSLAAAGMGMGGAPPISYSVGGDPAAIDQAASRIAQALRANGSSADVRTTNAGLAPRLQLDIDSQAAQLLNVSIDDAAQAARIATGGSLAMRARLPFGLENVIVQAGAAQAGDLEQLKRMMVRSGDGRLIPLADLAVVRESKEPTVIERENRERIVTVSANARGGAPIGLVTSQIAAKLRDPNFLPAGSRIEPRGDVEQFIDTMLKVLAALGFSVVVVYAILAILYRSYTVPLIVMVTVPLASIGAFGSLFLLNAAKTVFPNAEILQSQTLNLYSMLGIVMLVGLVAKNGILLVEYAERSIRAGIDSTEAMRAAALHRFRPILMTTFAMIAGMLPLALGHSIGAEYRRALGTVVIGGLSSSLLLTLFVVPVAYMTYRNCKSAGTSKRAARNGEKPTQPAVGAPVAV